MSGLADPALAVAAAAGAFGFALFFAKAPDVETAKIARLTINIFFMLVTSMIKDTRVGKAARGKQYRRITDVILVFRFQQLVFGAKQC